MLSKHFKQKEPETSKNINSKSFKKEVEIISQPKLESKNIISTQPQNSRNPISSIKSTEAVKNSTTSFTYQPNRALDKPIQTNSKPIIAETLKIAETPKVVETPKVTEISKPIEKIKTPEPANDTEAPKAVDQNSNNSQTKISDELSSFKELLESTQQMQRDRIKRK